MSDSSSSELEELGLNLQEFSRKRQVRFGSRSRTETFAMETSSTDLPSELQYMSLLNSGIALLKKNNDGNTQNRVKLPLDVRREGRKTIVSVASMAKVIHRRVEHLVNYITSDLGTSGSLNKDDNLVLKGNFITAEIQEVIRRYIEHFVVCKICENVEDTDIVKENKLYFLKCHKCGGSRCVGNINEGLTTKGSAKPQLRGML